MFGKDPIEKLSDELLAEGLLVHGGVGECVRCGGEFFQTIDPDPSKPGYWSCGKCGRRAPDDGAPLLDQILQQRLDANAKKD